MFREMPGLSTILDFDMQFLFNTIFIWINVAAIVFILGWLLYRPVLNFLQKRADRIQNDINTAEANRRDSQETKTMYEEKLAGIDIERTDILDNARKAASLRENEIINTANIEAAAILERARIEIEREREKARDEIKTQIIEISSLMAGRFVSNSIDAATKERLLNQAIVDLGDAKWTD
jgi:F-type H+-transporting ATPase subunit b